MVAQLSVLFESRNWNGWLFAILAAILLPQLFMSSMIAPDTGSYLHFSSVRPPLLPSVLWINHLLIGKSFYLFRFFQIGLIAFSMYRLDHYVRSNFNVPRWIVALALFLFLLPTYVFYPYGRYILSEGVCFPLFALLLVYLLEFFLHRETSAAVKVAICSGLLILARDQFLFLYGLMIFGVIWLFFQREPLKKIAGVALIFALTVGSVSVINRTYHYFANGSFSQNSETGPLLLIQPLFLSKESDSRYFKNAALKKDFLAVYHASHDAGFTLNSQPQLEGGAFFLAKYEIFTRVYARFSKVFDPSRVKSKNTLFVLRGGNPYQLNTTLMKIASVLLLHHWKNNLIFSLSKIQYSLGGPYLTLIWLMMGLVAFSKLLADRNNKIATVTILLLLTVFANNSAIAISEMILLRYLAYSFLAMLILFCIYLGVLYEK